jgi:hypothetical protein
MPAESNSDLQAVEAILAAFRADGKLPDRTPIYGVGMWQGGRLATLAGYALGMKATAIWVGAGHKDIMDVTTTPTIWCLADRDPIIDRQEVLPNISYSRNLVSCGSSPAVIPRTRGR